MVAWTSYALYWILGYRSSIIEIKEGGMFSGNQTVGRTNNTG